VRPWHAPASLVHHRLTLSTFTAALPLQYSSHWHGFCCTAGTPVSPSATPTPWNCLICAPGLVAVRYSQRMQISAAHPCTMLSINKHNRSRGKGTFSVFGAAPCHRVMGTSFHVSARQ